MPSLVTALPAVAAAIYRLPARIAFQLGERIIRTVEETTPSPSTSKEGSGSIALARALMSSFCVW